MLDFYLHHQWSSQSFNEDNFHITFQKLSGELLSSDWFETPLKLSHFIVLFFLLVWDNIIISFFNSTLYSHGKYWIVLFSNFQSNLFKKPSWMLLSQNLLLIRAESFTSSKYKSIHSFLCFLIDFYGLSA